MPGGRAPTGAAASPARGRGPLWGSCARRVAKDSGADQVLEGRPISEVRGKERRREFKGGPRNTVTTYEYYVTEDIQPRQWTCQARQHQG